MARLPQVGGDSGNWGAILNDFLSQSLAADGTLNVDSVGAPQLKPNSITNAAIAPATIAEDRLASDVQAKINNAVTPTDLAAKVDKTNTANRLYGTNGSANQSLYEVGTGSEGSVVTRRSGSRISVGTPTAGDDAARKDYVDTAISSLPAAPVQSVNGQTGNVTISVTKNDVGLGNVDNTSDDAKPVSAATQTALNSKVSTTTSTDNRVARFDGTDGQLQNSAVQIDDSGNLFLSAATSGTRRSLSGNGGNLSFGLNGVNVNSTNETALNFDVGNTGTGVLSVYKGATNQTGTKLAEVDNNGRFKVNTSSNLAKLAVQADSTNNEFAGLFMENGITPVSSATTSTMGRMLSVQGSGGAYFMGRDVTNSIEFIMGTSSGATAFAGSITNHNFDLRTGNASKLFIQHSNGNIGIGNTAPGEKLSVTGNITSSGTVNGRNVSADGVKVETYGMGTVVHAATASTARPTGFACVTWIGSVQPTNALTNDIWIYKA